MLHWINDNYFDVPSLWHKDGEQEYLVQSGRKLTAEEKSELPQIKLLALKVHISRIVPANVCRYCSKPGPIAGSWCVDCGPKSERWRAQQLSADVFKCWVCEEWKPKFSGFASSYKAPEWTCCEDCHVLIAQEFKSGGATFPAKPDIALTWDDNQKTEEYPKGLPFLYKVYNPKRNYYAHPCQSYYCLSNHSHVTLEAPDLNNILRKGPREDSQEINGWSRCQNCWTVENYLRVCTSCGNYDFNNTTKYGEDIEVEEEYDNGDFAIYSIRGPVVEDLCLGCYKTTYAEALAAEAELATNRRLAARHRKKMDALKEIKKMTI